MRKTHLYNPYRTSKGEVRCAFCGQTEEEGPHKRPAPEETKDDENKETES